VITLLDYGVNNIRSVEKALKFVGAPVRITSDPGVVESSDKLLVPGVGAFGQAMDSLRAAGLDRALRRAVGRNAHLLGICLGMQLLFETSEEHGTHEGLGLLKGHVKRLPDSVKVPHIGWNQIAPVGEDPLMKEITSGEFFYFDQSFHCVPDDKADRLADTDYGLSIASAVRRGNVRGVQFHPEKSQKAGLRMLENFARLK
jgi:glutamine amidotransferase